MLRATLVITGLLTFCLSAFSQEKETPGTEPEKPAFSIQPTEPLFMLLADGKKAEVQRNIIGNDSLSISPDLIFAIHLQKGEEAIENYGARAQNGVVVIELKKGSLDKVHADLRNKFTDEK